MDDWQREWIRAWELTLEDVEQFFTDIAYGMNDMVNSCLDFSAEMTEQLDDAIARSAQQFDEQMEDWISPVFQSILQLEDVVAEVAQPFTQTVEPMVNHHPLCIGCRHYHGQVYGDTMLVCAMHPYGCAPDLEQCPDKEFLAWIEPSAHSR